MKETADELIDRLERETGARVDEPGSPALAGLFGALSRELGQSPKSYRPCDDVAAGMLLQLQNTHENQARKRATEIAADLLCVGVNPHDLL